MSTGYRITSRPHGSGGGRGEVRRKIPWNVTSISTRAKSAPGRSARTADSSQTRVKLASSTGQLISIMKRPSSTPPISASMRAAIAFARQKRNAYIKTGGGRQVKTRDSSEESSRSSSPETTSDRTLKSGSRKKRRTDSGTLIPRDAARGSQEKQERLFIFRPGTLRAGSRPNSGVDRPNKLIVRPASSPAKTSRRTQENADNTKRKTKPDKFDDGLALFGRESSKGKKGNKSARVKISSADHGIGGEEAPQLVVGTEEYHEVVNRLCRPTVASIARATMKLIRARGPILKDPSSEVTSRKVRIQCPSEESNKRRFLGEQKMSDEKINEITIRLHQPTDRLHETRRFLTNSTSDGFGIVNSYMWICGEKLEQNQWERQTIEITRQNLTQSKSKVQNKLMILPFVKSKSKFIHQV